MKKGTKYYAVLDEEDDFDYEYKLVKTGGKK